MKKIIIINASPRKNWNTAQLLKEAQKGAQSAGAQTEYIDLYDLNFSGCRSCLACKRKDAERNKCYLKDDLSPLIEKILNSDGVIIGSPIYLGEPTAHFRALYERLLFCVLSYDNGQSYLDKHINVGLIYTMNAPLAYYQTALQSSIKSLEAGFRHLLRGEVFSYASCDTLQVKDYSQYSMGMFDAKHKKEMHDKQFPEDLKKAFEMAKNIVQ